jgi:hypothetical protein
VWQQLPEDETPAPGPEGPLLPLGPRLLLHAALYALLPLLEEERKEEGGRKTKGVSTQKISYGGSIT